MKRIFRDNAESIGLSSFDKLKRYFGYMTSEEEKKGKPEKPELEATKYTADLLAELQSLPEGTHLYDWLKTLYLRYAEKFARDNERIWTTAAIFIPLSLSGLAFLKDASFIRIVLLAIGSIKLMEFWVNIAENHRAFQNKSQAILKAVEERYALNFNRIGGTDYFEKMDCHRFITMNIQDKRWHMLYYVRRIWWASVSYASVKVIFTIIVILRHVPNKGIEASIGKIIDAFL